MIEPNPASEWPRDRLVDAYAQALGSYLCGGGEAALSRAYELGRIAVARGVGVVEVVLLHHAALRHVAPVAANDAEGRAATFLAESLSPFEMTHRGFQESATKLEQLNHTLQTKNEELEETARSLREAKVAAEEANRELEAFSYSVSHDLRAPLRSIDGFSQLLLEDCAESLNDNGRNYLSRVRAAAQRMGQLIDDLLLLARVGRTELSRRRIDLSEIVRQVVEDLQNSDERPNAVVELEAGVIAQADSRLMRIVFENLLGNAWKFTAKTAEPRIAFGATHHEEGTVYFVRDNGAGFDMAYAHKLFAPFQRLHREAEFPGTGIGLATVRRIINRHGGRVWVESAVGQGAAFYFTLAPPEAGARGVGARDALSPPAP
jgi:light-regulated signal transduction histidine kinase (bacteriophytochrome)